MPTDPWTGKYRPVIIKCTCGSNLDRYAIHDARNIFLTFACEQCEKEKLSHYRPDVLTDPHYPAPDLGDDEEL
jgi:hypothetical protein